MNRCLGWAFLVMLGIALGAATSSLQTTKAQDAADNPNEEIVAQLKEIKSELKDVNTYLRTGVVKTIAVMNDVPQ